MPWMKDLLSICVSEKWKKGAKKGPLEKSLKPARDQTDGILYRIKEGLFYCFWNASESGCWPWHNLCSALYEYNIHSDGHLFLRPIDVQAKTHGY